MALSGDSVWAVGAGLELPRVTPVGYKPCPVSAVVELQMMLENCSFYLWFWFSVVWGFSFFVCSCSLLFFSCCGFSVVLGGFCFCVCMFFLFHCVWVFLLVLFNFFFVGYFCVFS